MSRKGWISPQATASYGQSDTAATVAVKLVSAVNASSLPVTARSAGTVVTLTAKTPGPNSNYTLAAGSATSQPGTFSHPSFAMTVSGASLTGGQNGTTGGAMYSSTAYAPFGEAYAQTGTTDLSFAGHDQDTVSGTYDADFRRYNPVQGRWLSPDPSGLAAADPASPQSWNRYAYVLNNPLSAIDPNGLDCVTANENGSISIEGGDCPDIDPNNEYYIECDDCLDDATGGYMNSDGNLELISQDRILGVVGDNSGFNYTGFDSGVPGAAANNPDLPTLDNRANALAQAINKTGVQTLRNPCTAGAFYAGSALLGVGGGAAASVATEGAVFPELGSAVESSSYYMYQANKWLRRFQPVQRKIAAAVGGVLAGVATKMHAGCVALGTINW